MENFEFFIPTRVIFGKGTHLQVGKIVKEYGFHKVLVHFGGASAKKTGLLDAVLDALKAEGIGYVTLGGVQANPTLSMVRQGIELCLKETVDFVLAVGGGSVIDSAKCIADGAGNRGWMCGATSAMRQFPRQRCLWAPSLPFRLPAVR